MRPLIFFIVLIASGFIPSGAAMAQRDVRINDDLGASHDSLAAFHDSFAASRIHITKTAMGTLGSWATANIASGLIMAGQTQGQARAFWHMNAYWNVANLGIAALGYWNAARIPLRHYSYEDNLHEQHKLEKIYAINFALDFVYIGGGIILNSRSHFAGSPNSADQLAGYGISIITQGAFLLVMDAIMLHIHKSNTRRLNGRVNGFNPYRGKF
ncbi:MAG: hypothetical protein Q8927_09815 [Bacteroidota bacterium]|nr:hypothetical protein [Bacteroidota bacterium]MDP4216488.1 hypothetical protein [Bacteroidota bacterium]MDP4246235.1 hypothetical protein [Bacteroidota bacterium]MDP4260613.1 hypothetical protein [Bacteroidota bacterium]